MAFRWPLNNFSISQGFGGNAEYYRQFGQNGHNGLDLAAKYREPVYAADEGTVAFEGWGQNHSWVGGIAGIYVLLNNGGSYSGYAHLDETVVNQGQHVTKGQLIGYVGQTGTATGPHLHFEMLPLKPNFNNGFAGRINPMPYIETEQNATLDEIHQIFRELLGRDADPAGLAHYRQYPKDFVRQDVASSQEKRSRDAQLAEIARQESLKRAEEARKAAERQAAEEAARKAQEEINRIAAEEAAAKAKAEQRAKDLGTVIRQNNDLLRQLLALLQPLADKLNNIFR